MHQDATSPKPPTKSSSAASTPATPATVWDSGTVESAQQAFVPYGGPTLAADAAYTWTVRAKTAAAPDSSAASAAAAGVWGPTSKPAPFVTGLRTTDWDPAQWLEPAGASTQPDRVTYLRTEITPPAGTIQRATAYVSAAHTYRLYVNGDAVDAWPSFSYPDEQYVRAVDLTRTLRPGAANALGVLHRWYGPGQGRPASSPGLILAVSLWYDDGRHVVHGTDGTWREHPGRMAALAPTQLRRRRLRGVDRRAGLPRRLVEPRLRRPRTGRPPR